MISVRLSSAASHHASSRVALGGLRGRRGLHRKIYLVRPRDLRWAAPERCGGFVGFGLRRLAMRFRCGASE